MNCLDLKLMSCRSAVASEIPGTDRELAALADQFQQLRPEVLSTLSESFSKNERRVEFEQRMQINTGLLREPSNSPRNIVISGAWLHFVTKTTCTHSSRTPTRQK